MGGWWGGLNGNNANSAFNQVEVEVEIEAELGQIDDAFDYLQIFCTSNLVVFASQF